MSGWIVLHIACAVQCLQTFVLMMAGSGFLRILESKTALVSIPRYVFGTTKRNLKGLGVLKCLEGFASRAKLDLLAVLD